MDSGQKTESEPKTISLQPTAEGYAHMGATFAAAVLGDVRKARQTDSAALLRSLIEIAFYLGGAAENRDEALRLRAMLAERLPEGGSLSGAVTR